MKKHVFINLIVIFVLMMSVGIVPTQRASSAGTGPNSPDVNMPPPIIQFDGLPRTSLIPLEDDIPDTTGAVGHRYYMQAVNSNIALFAKNGGAPIATSTLEAFWTNAGATGTNCDADAFVWPAAKYRGQPYLIYDHLARRWVVVHVAFPKIPAQSGPYFLCVAVSRDENLVPPVGPTYFTPTYWHYYAINTNVSIYQYLPELPKLGLWADGYYLSADLYDVWNNGQNRTPKGVKVWALNRDDLQNGVKPFRFVDFYLNEHMGFEHLVPTNLLGNPPPTGTPNVFASIQPGKLYFWNFYVDWIDPSRSTFGTGLQNPNTTLNTDTASMWATGFIIPQLDSGENLDALGDRLMTPLQFRIVDGEYTYWVNHTIQSNGLAGLRWYEFHQDASGIPFVFQQGTWVPDAVTHRWLGSLAVDREGNMAIGYSASRADINPTIRFTGRLSTEPPGVLGPKETAFMPGISTGSANNNNGLLDGPWGRQSQMSVDPADECLFWYTNMYYLPQPPGPLQTWNTRIGAFGFSNCGGGRTVRVSLHTNGTQGNLSSGVDFEMYSTGISADGRFVVFSSEATNLVSGDLNNRRDIFLRDRDVDMDGIYDETGQVSTQLISRTPGGLPSNGDSWDVAISGDGRYIAYSSEASDLLLPGVDTNGTADVFVYDQVIGTTTRVSVGAGGQQAIGRSDQPSLSFTGRFIAFRSAASNLVPPTPMYSGTNVYLRDRDTDMNGFYDETGGVTTALVSRPNLVFGAVVPLYADAYTPTISDGDFDPSSPPLSQFVHVAYASRMMPPSSGVDPGPSWVFVSRFGANANMWLTPILTVPNPFAESYTPYISGNGQFVVYVSRLLVPPPYASIFLSEYNPALNIFMPGILISTPFSGLFAIGDSYSPSISRDGRFVSYASDANNLDISPPDLNNKRDIFLWDRDTGASQRISLDFNGGDANEWSFAPVIAGDGGYVAYVSEATDLVNNDTNNVWDVFVFTGEQVRPKFLSIPLGIPANPGDLVTVPVFFDSNGQSIDTTTFSVDFDQVCLSFNPVDSNADGIPDAITFIVPTDFFTSVLYNAADTKGELDFAIYDWIPPRMTLPDGVLLTMQFTVKATCQAVPGSSNSARVGFSSNPPPSFGYLGQSIAGSASDGYVRILEGTLGDCNGDGHVDAGDLSALVLEIFDGDGSDPMQTPFGTFPGNPVGCNPNQDYVVDAGDLSCTILVIQGSGATCTGLASIPAKTSWFDAKPSSSVKLDIPDKIPAPVDMEFMVPINLDTGGNAISSAVFSVDFDEAWLSMNPADSNHDGLPDSVSLALPPGFVATSVFDASDKDGELDLAVYSLTETLSNGILAKLVMKSGSPLVPILAAINWASDPRVSFGSTSGTSLAYLVTGGSAYLLPFRLFVSAVLG